MREQYKELMDEIEDWLHNNLFRKTLKSKNKVIVRKGIELAREWNSAIRSRDVIKL